MAGAADGHINFGARFDIVHEFTYENQVSPRVNVVWKPTSTTTLHAGYSRYFVPPPFELVSGAAVANFANTTAAPAVTQNDPVRAERSNYFDAGVTQVILPGLTVGIDAYYKEATNLTDEGQFGAPIILTAFNYAHGRVTGVEFTGSYDHWPWSIMATWRTHAPWERTSCPRSSIPPDELAYISQNFIHLDHDQTWTGSAGVSYTLNKDSNHPTLFLYRVGQGDRAAPRCVERRLVQSMRFAMVLAWGSARRNLGFAALSWRALPSGSDWRHDYSP